jgi:hypothetical protein
MQALESALLGQTENQAPPSAQAKPENAPTPAASSADTTAAQTSLDADAKDALTTPDAVVTAASPPARVAKPLIAVRGDDRPGAQKPRSTAPAPHTKRSPHAGRDRDARSAAHQPNERTGERAARAALPSQANVPRLGDAAFRAQRDALEQARLTLRKLAAQAHGESLTQLLAAWQQRAAPQIPSLQALGGRVNAATRNAWLQALAQPASSSASSHLLRLEMAAEVPTPAAHLDARRALQLQHLTQRHAAPPAQTWGTDVAQVLATAYNAEAANRLQTVLKILLKG